MKTIGLTTEPTNVLYMEATLRFSQPVALWDLSEVNAEGKLVVLLPCLPNYAIPFKGPHCLSMAHC